MFCCQFVNIRRCRARWREPLFVSVVRSTRSEAAGRSATNASHVIIRRFPFCLTIYERVDYRLALQFYSIIHSGRLRVSEILQYKFAPRFTKVEGSPPNLEVAKRRSQVLSMNIYSQ